MSGSTRLKQKRKNLTNPFTIRFEFRTFELVRFSRSGGTLNSAEQARQPAAPTKLTGEGGLRLEAISHAHQLKPTEKGDAMHLPFLLVEVAGLELAASSTRTVKAL